MGRYINTPEPKGKAEFLVSQGGMLIEKPTSISDVPDEKVLVCVVDNGPFEAAAICYSQEDFEEFSLPDDVGPSEINKEEDGTVVFHLRSEYQEKGMQRPRKWILIDRDHELVRQTMR